MGLGRALPLALAAAVLLGSCSRSGEPTGLQPVDSGGADEAGADAAESVVSPLVPEGELAPIVETLGVDVAAAVAVAGHVTLIQAASGALALQDETRSDATALGDAEHADGTALDAHNLLLLIDDRLEGDLEQYPGQPPQQQEQLEQQQQEPEQGQAADDEVQIVDPNGDEVRNWK